MYFQSAGGGSAPSAGLGGRRPYTISCHTAARLEGSERRAVRTSLGPLSAGTAAPRGSVFSTGRRGMSEALRLCWAISKGVFCETLCACGLHQPRVACVKRALTRWLSQTAETPARLQLGPIFEM